MDEKKQGSSLSTIAAFFVGGLIGSILGLLFAPLSGKETRARIRETSADAKDRTVETAARTKELTTEISEIAKEKAAELLNQGKERLTEVTGNLKTAVDVSKQAFVQQREEIRTQSVEGDEDSEDAEVVEEAV
ncbi:TPA: YtxH domain-containing protein [Candidatus Poribacteria bacterium]|jgi:gas vesicle protein|nr:YtxH domain-containing protein [Candidatus Poribacteria bacterium]HIB98926.1 YtxH domain-containing protein [Candidatus Poribacteria bacterium]HIC18927.1 YtxH domain-containing protein [Candidatus Poribacteria bacterium]HIM09776.1 YtxH domain-containing protein [Candidatus Poribacteria bacterium]HIN31060.1 YtxH domain-containing protein [Candidatus Poribacteria bacterium]